MKHSTFESAAVMLTAADFARPARPERRSTNPPIPIMHLKAQASRRPTAQPAEAQSVRGRDGKLVQIPAGYVAAQGRDGRVVAVPSGSGTLEGADGRVVAIPPGHLGIENAKGRVVPKPRW
jgi:hypothetical protein